MFKVTICLAPCTLPPAKGKSWGYIRSTIKQLLMCARVHKNGTSVQLCKIQNRSEFTTSTKNRLAIALRHKWLLLSMWPVFYVFLMCDSPNEKCKISPLYILITSLHLMCSKLLMCYTAKLLLTVGSYTLCRHIKISCTYLPSACGPQQSKLPFLHRTDT